MENNLVVSKGFFFFFPPPLPEAQWDLSGSLPWVLGGVPRGEIHKMLEAILSLGPRNFSLSCSQQLASSNSWNLPFYSSYWLMALVASASGRWFYLWFSKFAYQSRFWCSSLPCDLNSLLGTWKVIDFLFVQLSCFCKDVSDDVQGLCMSELKPKV